MPDDNATYDFTVSENENGVWTISLFGQYTVQTAAAALKQLSARLKNYPSGSIRFDLSSVSHMDDYGALVLYELKHMLKMERDRFVILNPPENFRKMVEMVEFDADRHCPPVSGRSRQNIIVELGEATFTVFSGVKFFVSFTGSIVLAGARVFKKPKSLRVEDIIRHMKTTGVDALPVVALISFLLGLIMAFMSSLQLRPFGASIYVASLVALAMVSELGPIMTAIIVAGRSGSAYAAEISSMKISEEIDALITMGFDPVLFLVLPRLIAAVLVIPLLTVFSNLFAISGGLMIGITMLDLTPGSYMSQTIATLTLFDLLWGIFKSFVFASLIASIGCLRGFQARGGASSVGKAATSAVVTSIFLIILFDSIFAVIRSQWR